MNRSNDDESTVDDGNGTDRAVEADLPFLVTHWLSGYAAQGQDGSDAALRIQKATAELASAFAELGAFGSTVRPVGLTSERPSAFSTEPSQLVHATYADRKRQWSRCPPQQLSHLLQAGAIAGEASVQAVQEYATPNNLTVPDKHEETESGGRTLQDAIDLENESAGAKKPAPVVASFLQPPVLLEKADSEARDDSGAAAKSTALTLPLDSCRQRTSVKAGKAMRRYLEVREQCRQYESQIQAMQRSLRLRKASLADLEQQRLRLDKQQTDSSATNGGAETSKLDSSGHQLSAAAAQLDQISAEQQNCERVVAQLERQLPLLCQQHTEAVEESRESLQAAKDAWDRRKAVLENYRDTVAHASLKNATSSHRLLLHLQSARRSGVGSLLRQRRLLSAAEPSASQADVRKDVLYNRFSHAATVNTHLSYPVYCLRFDRSGRFFITGADDYLVRVFCLGAYVATASRQACRRTNNRVDPASYTQGAVLVCTLKGHAGVINDICVSSDNCFLATASEDGDCRVWGLRDGCPVAILRGHKGGANMVSWSTLTPYRLVTTGADGLARTWDVREACLKRYGSMTKDRPEYCLELIRNAGPSSPDGAAAEPEESQGGGPLLPPLPARGENEVAASVPQEPAIPLPPLPPAADVGEQPAANGNDDDEEPGLFVANDAIDEGVKLLCKLQHGASHDERMVGPGTRSRRAPVKVICVARCPYGGHFATGSDDGICRVWRDEGSSDVDTIDDLISPRSVSLEQGSRPRPLRRTEPDRLLLTMKGHLSPITDLQYSFHGDRILTASQKDGVVRIWSYNVDPCSAAYVPSDPSRESPVSHILIKLTNPNAESNIAGANGPRRRPARSSTNPISCDVAQWTHDDAKIVTSQSELVKQSGTQIVPGSQYLFLWDSVSGQCLLGIYGAHTMQCPVLIPHPIHSSVICSAGADGMVKLWDLEAGKCIFSHENTCDFGPVDANERGKLCGYLDGAFSPDGLDLVITDDSGRVTIFGCCKPSTGTSSGSEHPFWMKEQYFSNDYYDLFYDPNGYCVERGSEQPPHLAPKGARCSHSGAPTPDPVNEAFKHLSGPIPSPADSCRRQRQHVRSLAEVMRQRRVQLRGNFVSQYDSKTTKLVQQGEKKAILVTPKELAASLQQSQRQVSSTAASRVTIRSPTRLSSNWRWGDAYNDALREERDDDMELDSDDEEFELTEGRGTDRTSATVGDSDSDDLDDERMEERPSRSSSRPARRSRYIEEDSDEEELLEYMSTNNMPSGPYVQDYTMHYWRMPEKRDVSRSWVRRNESSSSFGGRKKYTPQVGDSVIYIPRAHYATISQFPSLDAPWQSWPEESEWPVVRCSVRNVRYRFPFKAYYGGRSAGRHSKSVVAILTLQVTGIPELSIDRIFSWPKASFIEPSKIHIFELSVFDNDQDDYIIPAGLYISRLTQLEEALSDPAAIPEFETFYADEGGHEDSEFIPYRGKVVGYADVGPDLSDPNLCLSGYDSVTIEWDTGEPGSLSPWEISVRNGTLEAPSRPSLDESGKKRIRDALSTIKGLPGVEDVFAFEVDVSRYTDYFSRVEVPMDLSFIANRLEADYYSTRLSTVADVRLILTNCLKYNGDDELSVLAKTMFEKFEELVLDPEERTAFHEFDAPIVTGNQDELQEADHQGPSPRRVLRRRVQRRSSLEDLPAPEETRTTRSRRPGLRNRPSTRNTRSQDLRRSTRSVLETNQPQGIRTLEELSSGGRRASRGRTNAVGTRVSARLRRGQQNNDSQRQRRSARIPPTRADENHDLPSVHESTRQSSRWSLRSIARNQAAASDQVGQALAPTRRLRTTRNAPPAEPYPSEGEEEPSHPHERRLAPLALAPTLRRSTRNAPPAEPYPSEGGEEPSHPHERRLAPLALAPTLRRRSTRNAPPAEPYPSQGGEYSADDDQDHQSDSTDSFAESTAARRSSSGRAGRRTTRTHIYESPEEEESKQAEDSDEFEVDKEESSPGSEMSEDESSPGSEDAAYASPRRRSSRARSSRELRDTPDPESDMDASNQTPQSPRNKRKRRSIESDPARHSPRSRSGRASVSYVDPSSSEFTDSDEEDEPVSKRRRTTQYPGKKGSKRNLTMKSEVESWPEISMRAITDVTNEILRRLRELDQEGTFALPVVEAFPYLSKDYKRVIKEPMDFRTIEEDRLPVYRSIRELQKDLVLVFTNCIKFNEQGSELASFARVMLDSMDDIFHAVCEEQGVRMRSS